LQNINQSIDCQSGASAGREFEWQRDYSDLPGKILEMV
jgi:hypothetical protein